MSFFDFDGSPNKTSDFSFSFGGEPEAKPNGKPSAFNFDWDDNEVESRAKEPSPKTVRTTPVKPANPCPKLRPNGNEMKNKSHQEKNVDQPMSKVPRISPTKGSNGQRPNVHHGASAKTATTPSPRKVSENKVLENQNLQASKNGKPNDVQTSSNDDDHNLPDNKESMKKSEGESDDDELGLDQVLKKSLERLNAKISSLAPVLKKQEDAVDEILGKASLLMSEICQYRESLEETKHHFSSRLNQVASCLKKPNRN